MTADIAPVHRTRSPSGVPSNAPASDFTELARRIKEAGLMAAGGGWTDDTSMVPLLTLGIPGSGATAVILGAFLLHGVQPGPQLFTKDPALVYAIFASLFAGVIGMCPSSR